MPASRWQQLPTALPSLASRHVRSARNVHRENSYVADWLKPRSFADGTRKHAPALRPVVEPQHTRVPDRPRRARLHDVPETRGVSRVPSGKVRGHVAVDCDAACSQWHGCRACLREAISDESSTASTSRAMGAQGQRRVERRVNEPQATHVHRHVTEARATGCTRECRGGGRSMIGPAHNRCESSMGDARRACLLAWCQGVSVSVCGISQETGSCPWPTSPLGWRVLRWSLIRSSQRHMLRLMSSFDVRSVGATKNLDDVDSRDQRGRQCPPRIGWGPEPMEMLPARPNEHDNESGASKTLAHRPAIIAVKNRVGSE